MNYWNITNNVHFLWAREYIYFCYLHKEFSYLHFSIFVSTQMENIEWNYKQNKIFITIYKIKAGLISFKIIVRKTKWDWTAGNRAWYSASLLTLPEKDSSYQMLDIFPTYIPSNMPKKEISTSVAQFNLSRGKYVNQIRQVVPFQASVPLSCFQGV